VNLACFHSRRLESTEVHNRLLVADSVLWDMLTYETHRGRLGAFRAIDDAMEAVTQFMILPRLWPPRRLGRKMPPHRFPNEPKLYSEITAPLGDEAQPNWRALRLWIRQRELELAGEEEQ
jgi:hypothetical protein